MYYMFSIISLVFAIWGVSKDTVFALSSVLLKRQCLRLRQLGWEPPTTARHQDCCSPYDWLKKLLQQPVRKCIREAQDEEQCMLHVIRQERPQA